MYSVRQQQDLNLRGQSPSDFESDALTTRPCCPRYYVLHSQKFKKMFFWQNRRFGFKRVTQD
jgi:hypothetical protein